ncbi:hypothetical protein [Cyclobacterium sp.]|uniref:hypothetical protein n=1 Tax=Cyclobacterium sp. TaxID=1966343 RepID=UPI00199634E0|nr:hypothetical protein [Cyclobacterium sp.]MBD3628562.1 hypothetical protein [Cyclobacterium sp.]
MEKLSVHRPVYDKIFGILVGEIKIPDPKHPSLLDQSGGPFEKTTDWVAADIAIARQEK